eukprot:13790687-Alexandrium_andersonii.AAC.1
MGRAPGGTRRHAHCAPIEPSSESNRSNRVAPACIENMLKQLQAFEPGAARAQKRPRNWFPKLWRAGFCAV